jgi:hydroxymethylbilane synthase
VTTANTLRKTLTIGSRGSQLALWQAHHTATLLARCGVATEIKTIKTTGDHLQTASLVQAGGKGLFTKEIEEALLNGQIDLAVHSLKDLPTEHPPGLAIAAIPEREDPRDAMAGSPVTQLPNGARVGTSSGRRGAQLKLVRPDLSIEPIRGNVDTRLNKLKAGQYDAIMLAAAGLKRLGLAAEIAQLFTPEEICPAPGQGALAIQTREKDEAFQLCAALDHAETRLAVTCERAALAALGGGCQLPIGVYASLKEGELHVLGVVAVPDGSRSLRAERHGPASDPCGLGQSLAQMLVEKGAATLLTQSS